MTCQEEWMEYYRKAFEHLQWVPCTEGFKFAMLAADQKVPFAPVVLQRFYCVYKGYVIIKEPLGDVYDDRAKLDAVKKEIRRREFSEFNAKAGANPAFADPDVAELRRRWTWNDDNYTLYADEVLVFCAQHRIRFSISYSWSDIYSSPKWSKNAAAIDEHNVEWNVDASVENTQYAAATPELIARAAAQPTHVVVGPLVFRPTETVPAKLHAFYTAVDRFKGNLKDMVARAPKTATMKTTEAAKNVISAFLARTDLDAQVQRRMIADHEATTFYVSRLPASADDTALVAALRASDDWAYDRFFPSSTVHAIHLKKNGHACYGSNVLGVTAPTLIQIVLIQLTFLVGMFLSSVSAYAPVLVLAVLVLNAIAYLYLQLYVTRRAITLTVRS